MIFDGWLRVVTGLFSLFSVGVTLWALQMFLTLVSKLMRVFLKIRDERKKFGAASQKTMDEYNEILCRAEAFLKSKELKTEAK